MVWLKLSTSLLSFISKINLPVPKMWLANPHSILRGGFSLSRAKAVFIPPAELVVVARSSYPDEKVADSFESATSGGDGGIRTHVTLLSN